MTLGPARSDAKPVAPRRATAFLLLLLVGLAGSFAVQGHAAASASPLSPPFAWRTEPVDTNADTGLYTSIALDGQGNPAIFYLDYTNGTLRLARLANGTWTSGVVDGPGTFVGDTNVVIGPNDTTQVSYFDAYARRVMYGVETPTGWTRTAIGAGIIDGYNRLALDHRGRPAIAYTGYSGELLYASWNGTAWNTEVVDDTQILSRYPGLAFDSQDRPHLSYAGDNGLDYATKVNGIWTRENVDPVQYTGWYSMIRVDSLGNPHIAYYASANGSLMYASRTGGVWTLSAVDQQGDSGWDLSFAIDSLNRPQIAYYSRDAGFLRFAILDRGVWVRETADNAGVVGWYTGIAVDASDLPHISYYDWTHGSLKYAIGTIALQVRSAGASAPDSRSALLRGELVALGNHSSVDVGFSFRPLGNGTWSNWSAGSRSSAGLFTVTITNLTAGVTYQFRAEATAGNETSTGSILPFSLPVPKPPSPPYLFIASTAIVAAISATAVVLVLRRRRERPGSGPKPPTA